jgi:hypothetical protein
VSAPEASGNPVGVGPDKVAPGNLGSARYIEQLSDNDESKRAHAALALFTEGTARIADWIARIEKDEEFRKLIVQERMGRSSGESPLQPKLTVGIAVNPERFEKIRASNGSPLLADAPADEDVLEFELEFAPGLVQPRLDILTTRAPGGTGAIARFLQKFGEGVQQVEVEVTDVDRATEILRNRFALEPIYPATRLGADRTRVNFFLVAWNEKKVLVELVEKPR